LNLTTKERVSATNVRTAEKRKQNLVWSQRGCWKIPH